MFGFRLVRKDRYKELMRRERIWFRWALMRRWCADFAVIDVMDTFLVADSPPHIRDVRQAMFQRCPRAELLYAGRDEQVLCPQVKRVTSKTQRNAAGDEDLWKDVRERG